MKKSIKQFKVFSREDICKIKGGKKKKKGTSTPDPMSTIPCPPPEPDDE